MKGSWCTGWPPGPSIGCAASPGTSACPCGSLQHQDHKQTKSTVILCTKVKNTCYLEGNDGVNVNITGSYMVLIMR